MAGNFRVPWKNANIAQGLPTSGAGSAAGDPVINKGVVGVNLWGTGKGEGVPTGGSYGILALDGTAVFSVNIVTTAVTENDLIYITSANALTNVSTSNTFFGYADEPGAVGAATKIGVRIKSQVNA